MKLTFYRLRKERINVGLNRINGLYDHLNGRREQRNDAKFSQFHIACVCVHTKYFHIQPTSILIVVAKQQTFLTVSTKVL